MVELFAGSLVDILKTNDFGNLQKIKQCGRLSDCSISLGSSSLKG